LNLIFILNYLTKNMSALDFSQNIQMSQADGGEDEAFSETQYYLE
jgi:hypothetical protein